MGAEVIEEVKGTAVRDISARASDITNDMTLGQLIDVSGNKILGMVADSTISGLSEDINGLAVNQLYADNIYTSSAKAEALRASFLRLKAARNITPQAREKSFSIRLTSITARTAKS